MTRKYVKKTDRTRANNTDLYVYGSLNNKMIELATMGTDVDKFIHGLTGGEKFQLERRVFVGECKSEIMSIEFEVERVYPHFVMCIGPTGRRCGMTYADVYFGMHKKELEVDES